MGAGVGGGIHNDHLKYIFSIISHVYFDAQHVKLYFVSREHRTIVCLSFLFFLFHLYFGGGKNLSRMHFCFCPKVWEDQV